MLSFCLQAYRRPIEDYTSSPYDDIVVDDIWDSQRINHEIFKRSDVVADRRPKYINKSARSKTTTASSAASSADAHGDAVKGTGHIPVYRVRGKSKNATHRTPIDATTAHSVDTTTQRNKHRKTFQLKPRQFVPRNSAANGTEGATPAVAVSRPAATTEATIATSSTSAANYRHTFGDGLPVETATKRAANGRRYRIRVVEASPALAKTVESSTESARSTAAIAANNTDAKSKDEPNYPAAPKGYY